MGQVPGAGATVDGATGLLPHPRQRRAYEVWRQKTHERASACMSHERRRYGGTAGGGFVFVVLELCCGNAMYSVSKGAQKMTQTKIDGGQIRLIRMDPDSRSAGPHGGCVCLSDSPLSVFESIGNRDARSLTHTRFIVH